MKTSTWKVHILTAWVHWWATRSLAYLGRRLWTDKCALETCIRKILRNIKFVHYLTSILLRGVVCEHRVLVWERKRSQKNRDVVRFYVFGNPWVRSSESRIKVVYRHDICWLQNWVSINILVVLSNRPPWFWVRTCFCNQPWSKNQ